MLTTVLWHCYDVQLEWNGPARVNTLELTHTVYCNAQTETEREHSLHDDYNVHKAEWVFQRDATYHRSDLDQDLSSLQLGLYNHVEHAMVTLKHRYSSSVKSLCGRLLNLWDNNLSNARPIDITFLYPVELSCDSDVLSGFSLVMPHWALRDLATLTTSWTRVKSASSWGKCQCAWQEVEQK